MKTIMYYCLTINIVYLLLMYCELYKQSLLIKNNMIKKSWSVQHVYKSDKHIYTNLISSLQVFRKYL